jgi:hypothetical protein
MQIAKPYHKATEARRKRKHVSPRRYRGTKSIYCSQRPAPCISFHHRGTEARRHGGKESIFHHKVTEARRIIRMRFFNFFLCVMVSLWFFLVFYIFTTETPRHKEYLLLSAPSALRPAFLFTTETQRHKEYLLFSAPRALRPAPCANNQVAIF